MAGSSRAGYDDKVANLWAARIIPVILIGIKGYVSWVIIHLIGVNYLLKPSASASSHLPRPHSATAVIIVYSILLLLVGISYFRLLYTVITNPGYVERGPQWFEKNEKDIKRKNASNGAGKLRGHDLRRPRRRTMERSRPRGGSHLEGFDYMSHSTASRPTAVDETSRDLQEHYTKEVFVCEGNGYPVWCSICMNWKPDRAHHCREVDRCVRKMDHYCPWVAGVIGETTFKFFIQYSSWAAVYCIYILVITAIVIAEERTKRRTPNIHWIVTLSLAALFTLFSGGMSGSSFQYVFQNTTLIENLSRQSKVWQLAVHTERPPINQNGIGFPSITYPLGDEATTTSAPNSKRTFIILHSKPGENPWNLGWFANFKTVLGVHWWDWLLPLRHSPLRDHSRGESQFELGPVVERMRAEAGLIPLTPLRDSNSSPSHQRSSRWIDFSSRTRKSRRSRDGEREKDAGDTPQSPPKRKRRKRGSTRNHDDHATNHNNNNNNDNNEGEEEQQQQQHNLDMGMGMGMGMGMELELRDINIININNNNNNGAATNPP